MKDFGRKEKMLFLNPRRSRAWWIFIFALLGVAGEYAVRTWWL